ncbi:hypothetical protein J6590_054363 [Homalodisca vitripennis]|nr:hypothetical protein J6590_054363 [Homalodisca vitripennis]
MTKVTSRSYLLKYSKSRCYPGKSKYNGKEQSILKVNFPVFSKVKSSRSERRTLEVAQAAVRTSNITDLAYCTPGAPCPALHRLAHSLTQFHQPFSLRSRLSLHGLRKYEWIGLMTHIDHDSARI